MNAQIIGLQKIWDNAPHNAFTDLIRFQGSWFCVFREGSDHVSPDGKIRVLNSTDGINWTPCALIGIPDVDLRDPKLSITPSSQLLLNACAAFRSASVQRHQSLVWPSRNGFEWDTPIQVGDPDFWLWRLSWHKGVAYGMGYHTAQPPGVRLYSSCNAVRFNMVADDLCDEGSPNEATLLFREANSALCLLRRDGSPATAMLGNSQSPFREWTWTELAERIGGPNMLLLPDGRIVAAVRRYGEAAWTSLNWLNPDEGMLSEFLALPSGGDTSYAGLAWHENLLWISYYSSHEQHASIYLARVKLPAGEA